jgi:predicted Zn-dependent peptidase
VLTATLPNGAELVAIRTPHLHSGVIDAHVLVGARYETREHAGISHFLEHMLYRGTRRHPSAYEQALAFESVAGMLSAATMVDQGSLAVAMPENGFDEVLPLFWEAFREPLLEAIDLERSIVEEEILESLDEDGRLIDGDTLVRELCFEQHPLGFPITGTLEHLPRFDESSLRRHHTAHYTGACTVVTVAGPFDPEHVLTQLSRYFGELPQGRRPEYTAPAAQSVPRFRFVRNPGSQTALRVAFRAPGRHHPLEAATEILLRILDDGMSTRLYHRICDVRGLCYDVSASYEPYADVGLFDVQADTLHERANHVLEELLRVALELRNAGPTDAELVKAKRRASWELGTLLDDAAELAEFSSTARLCGVAVTPQARAEQLQSVTQESVRQAAEAIFRRENLNVVAVGLLPRRAREALAAQVAAFA